MTRAIEEDGTDARNAVLSTPPPWGGRASRHLVSILKGLPITARKFEIILREDYNFLVKNPQKVNPIIVWEFKT